MSSYTKGYLKRKVLERLARLPESEHVQMVKFIQFEGGLPAFSKAGLSSLIRRCDALLAALEEKPDA